MSTIALDNKIVFKRMNLFSNYGGRQTEAGYLGRGRTRGGEDMAGQLPGQDDCCPLVLTTAYKTPAQSCSLQIGFDLKHKKVKMNLKVNCL